MSLRSKRCVDRQDDMELDDDRNVKPRKPIQLCKPIHLRVTAVNPELEINHLGGLSFRLPCIIGKTPGLCHLQLPQWYNFGPQEFKVDQTSAGGAVLTKLSNATHLFVNGVPLQIQPNESVLIEKGQTVTMTSLLGKPLLECILVA